MDDVVEILKDGWGRHQAGNWLAAGELYERALRAEPGHPDGRYLLGLLRHDQHRYAQAVEQFRLAIAADESKATYHSELANAYRALGQLDEAQSSYERAVALRPEFAAAHNNLGNVHRQRGQILDAIACYQRARQHDPNLVDASYNLGTIYQEQFQPAQAVESFLQAIAINANHWPAYYQLGRAYEALDRPAEAIQAYRDALRLRPGAEEVACRLGRVFAAQQRWEECIATYREIIAQVPRSIDAHFGLGEALCTARRFALAEACYQSLLALRHADPAALTCLGIVQLELGRHEDSIASLRRAIAAAPAMALAHNSLGATYENQGDYEQALACFHEAVRLDPTLASAQNNLATLEGMYGHAQQALERYDLALGLEAPGEETASCHYNRAMALLRLGNFEQGWPELEWRWNCGWFEKMALPQPLWNGSELHGQRILVHAEQGLGDTLQFVRYLQLVAQRGGRVTLAVRTTLTPLLRASNLPAEIVDSWRTRSMSHAREQPTHDFEVRIPLLSLPGVFKTTLSTIPQGVPYLSAPAALCEEWGQRLAHLRGLRVGIHWQGNPDYVLDRARSIPLAEFAPLAKTPGVVLISLQQKQGVEQLRDPKNDFTVHELGPDVDQARGAFMDTAAVLRNLDVVVTSDSAVAHLAGALGVRVWLVLSTASDWRWLLDREDCPWYPTMRIFRQRQLGDWQEVFARITAELAGLERKASSHGPHLGSTKQPNDG